VTSYRFDVTCARCGSDLVDRDESEVPSPDRSTAEAWCSECLIVWRIEVALVPTDAMALLFEGSDEARRRRAGEALGGIGQAVFQ
jgi:hypothetical protein